MKNFALYPTLCTSVLALLLCGCGTPPESTAQEEEVMEEAVPRTNIRLAKRNDQNEFVAGTSFTRATDHIEQIMPPIYQSEGPAWENDKVGFRMYFDRRNGIDIFGKKVSDMVLDTVGYDRNNYHEMSDWGMDVLKVGNSLGAGGIGLMADGQAYRLGDATEETVRITESSDDRSTFEVKYTGWEVAGRTLDLTWTFTIEAGTHDYTSTVQASGLTGGEELLIGIVNLHSDTLYTMEKGDRFVAYTHGPQAEGDHYLGMALSLDKSDYLAHGEFAPDAQPISSTYYLQARLENGQPTTYRFTAGWAPGNPAFENRDGFVAVIR
ncbi:MAG: DUF4861 family protein [Bacteroidota bacterium]